MRMITKALASLIAIGIGLVPVVAHARSTGANDGCSLRPNERKASPQTANLAKDYSQERQGVAVS